MNWSSKEILITGGTGSLGKALTKLLQQEYNPHGIRIYSRSELHQWNMRQELESLDILDNVSFLIGDVRDYYRLELAMQGVDIVIHAAALKQITACQENPIEAIQTNILGSQNILMAALKTKPEKLIGISTDKACRPINLYGRTKACMENLFIHGNIYTGGDIPKISCTRYGNILGSNGSVVQAWGKSQGKIKITDPRMTRFWTTLDTMSKFILSSLEIMEGSEIFIPKMASCAIIELAELLGHTEYEIIGIREGEKMHETLITEEESKDIFELENSYIISKEHRPIRHSKFEYRSDNNVQQITKKDIEQFII